MNEMGRILRRRLIAGLVVIAPLGVTAFVLWWIFVRLDSLLGGFVYDALGFPIPGLGLLMLIALLLGVGWLAERTVGGQIADLWHRVMDRVPVVSRLYHASRRIVGSVFGGGEQRFFKEVVLFQYPARGQWTLGFVTGKAPVALADRVEDGLTIFLPTAPNPVTGFLIVVARSETMPLPITVEEGFTYILSAGAVPPTAKASAASRAAAVVAEHAAREAQVSTEPPGT